MGQMDTSTKPGIYEALSKYSLGDGKKERRKERREGRGRAVSGKQVAGVYPSLFPGLHPCHI